LKGYNFNFREDPLMLKLDNGRYIHIEGANLLFSQKEIPEDMYYQYEPPEGTLVPAGKYIVGVDIPEGDYIFAPATSTAGLFIIYESEEDAEKALKNNEVYYWTLSKNIEVKNREAYMLAVYKDDSTHSVPLREGEAVVITSTDAIMKKVEKAKLSFD